MTTVLPSTKGLRGEGDSAARNRSNGVSTPSVWLDASPAKKVLDPEKHCDEAKHKDPASVTESGQCEGRRRQRDEERKDGMTSQGACLMTRGGRAHFGRRA